MFNDELSREQVEDSTIPSVVWPEIKAYGFDQDMRAAYMLMQQPDNAWWDDVTTENTVETRDDVLLRSFQEGYANAICDLGKDRKNWKWGTLHTVTFVSMPLGESDVGFIESRVNRGLFSVGGSEATINANSWTQSPGAERKEPRDFTVSTTPVTRMIVDLGNLTQSVNILVPGQSGHPYSDNYSDTIQPWLNMEQHTMLWTRQQVEASAVERLILNPSQ